MKRVLTLSFVVWLEMLRRKEIYVFLFLLLAFLFILMALNIFGLGKLIGYLKEIGLLLAWLFSWILAVNIATRLLPREEKQGTIFLLLAKPVNRYELVLGKWLGAWGISSFATLVFYMVLVILVYLRGAVFRWEVLAQGLLLHIELLGMLSALGVMFSTRLNSDAAASITYIVSLAAVLILPHVPYLVMHVKGFAQAGLLILYYILPHFELFDMRMRIVHNWDPVLWWNIGKISGYAIAVMAIFISLAWLGYRNKRFTRGAIQ